MKFAKRVGMGAVALSSFLATSAFAGDLADAITAGATEAKGEISAAGVVIIGVVVAIAVIGWVRRVIK